MSIDSKIQMRDQSLIKQIKCPSTAKSRYNTDFSTGLDNSSIKFVTSTMIPEISGYLVGYNFSGKGSNESQKWKARSGFQSVDRDDEPDLYRDRVLGYNYFVPLNTKCGSMSATACKGKKKYQYIRNYPVTLKGNVSNAMLEDVLDLNPVSILQGLFSIGATSRCVHKSLPVGSGLENKAKQFTSKAAFVKNYNKCLAKCYKAKTGVDNCRKNCFRGWWVEKKCIDPPTVTVTRRYPAKKDNSGRQFKIPSMVGLFETFPREESGEAVRAARGKRRAHAIALSLLVATLVGIGVAIALRRRRP